MAMSCTSVLTSSLASNSASSLASILASNSVSNLAPRHQTRRPLRALFTALLLWALSAVLTAALASGPGEKCKEFLLYGLPGATGELLCRTGFALAHDETTKTPVWVAQRMTPERLVNRVTRTDRFAADPDLPPGKRAELEDYRGSGYDRGHMAPAADMRWSVQAMEESFYLSNMAPQVGPGMNRGVWAEIESTIRRWVSQRGELFIFTGPIVAQANKTAMPNKASSKAVPKAQLTATERVSGAALENKAPAYIGPNAVAVPTHFYKVVFDPVRVEAIAFVVPNAPHANRKIDEFITSVRDIEARTGLDFLNRINPAVQALIEEAVAPALW